MAADVSYLVRLNGGDANDAADSTAPITRDLLGRCCAVDSQELDLDLQVPSGWEKHLDLKSGKVYFNKCKSSCVTSDKKKVQCGKAALSCLEDLNCPPATKQSLNLFDDPSLELPLPAMPSYQSVCTLDKVKSALERAEKESRIGRKRSRSMSHSSKDEKKPSTPVAAGCPCCLMYVLISRTNPKCPRCNTIVPVPPKRPRLDLNISI